MSISGRMNLSRSSRAYWLAASQSASGGFGCASMKKPSTPAATAARASVVEKLPRAAARVLARDAVLANRVASVEHDGIADLIQQVEAARIDDEVVVAERVAALGDDDAVVARVFDLLDGLRHVLGREELAVLDVDDGARFGRRDDELRLHAQIRRDLDDVADFPRRRRLIRIVDVREHRQVELALDLLEQLQARRRGPGLGRTRASCGCPSRTTT